jgi:hypothetical protein
MTAGNLKGLLGVCFGDGINCKNTNYLTCRFKSRCKQVSISAGPTELTAMLVALVVRYARRPATLAQSSA